MFKKQLKKSTGVLNNSNFFILASNLPRHYVTCIRTKILVFSNDGYICIVLCIIQTNDEWKS